MAQFALWTITGFLCVLTQLHATDVADRFEDERLAAVAVFGMGLFAPLAILGFAVYASLELLP